MNQGPDVYESNSETIEIIIEWVVLDYCHLYKNVLKVKKKEESEMSSRKACQGQAWRIPRLAPRQPILLPASSLLSTPISSSEPHSFVDL